MLFSLGAIPVKTLLSSLNINHLNLQAGQIKIAHNPSELHCITAFRNKQYAKSFPNLAIDNPDPLDQNAITLFSRTATGQVNSCARFVCDGPLGLPEDSLLASYIEPYRKEGFKLAGIGRFVIKIRDTRLLQEYYRVFYNLALLLNIDYIMLLIRDKEIKFYKKRIGALVLTENTGYSYGGPHYFAGVAWPVKTTDETFLRWIRSSKCEDSGVGVAL